MYNNIGFLPLDSRPCCCDFTQKIARIAGYDLNCPPLEWFKDFSVAADQAKMSKWLLNAAEKAEYLIVSTDMLIYGGIATACRHHIEVEEALQTLDVLRQIRKRHPNIKLYVSGLVQGSSDTAFTPEELVHRSHNMSYSQLSHKITVYDRQEDKEKLDELMKIIDQEALDSYLKVRERCHKVCLALVDMAADGTVDYISFGVIDTSVYGLHRLRKADLLTAIYHKMVMHKANLYCAADEQGQILVTRAMLDHQQITPRFFPRYSSRGAETFVAMYDDLPLGDTLRHQVYAAGCLVVDTPNEADAVFMINSPLESFEVYNDFFIGNKNIFMLPEPGHNLWDFVSAIKYYLKTGKRVSVTDVAFANGSDVGLVRFMEKEIEITDLTAYSGWNTASNSLGTAVAHTAARIIYEQSANKQHESEIAHFEFLLERFADEYFYQVVVRPQTMALVESLGESFLNFSDKILPEVNALTREKLTELVGVFFEKYFKGRSLKDPFADRTIESLKFSTWHPWTRTFEVWVDAKFGCSIQPF